MRPNFEEMTSAELRAYALAHRDDVEPLRVLYSRRSPDSEAIWYGPMCTPEGVPIEENIRIAEEAIRQRDQRDREKRNNNMTTVTQAEIEQFRIQLADNLKALADLEVIDRCEGDLERAARVLARRSGLEEVRLGANWQIALQKARELVCDDKFKDGLAPGLIGGLIGTLAASGSPILAAVATPVGIYITQASIGAFCKSQKSVSEDEENPS
jgi:hypothetical protein